MKKVIRILLILSGILFSPSLFAQVYYGKEASQKVSYSTVLRIDPEKGTPSFIDFGSSGLAPTISTEQWLKELLKADAATHFQLKKQSTDQLGFQHFRYQQYWNDIPVEDSRYYVHAKDGLIQSVNGTYVDKIKLSTVPLVSAQDALTSALFEIQASQYKWDASLSPFGPPSPELVLLSHENSLQLVYKYDIYALVPLSHQHVYVSATTAKVLTKREQLHSSDTPATAITRYRGAQSIVTDSLSPTTYRLRESGRGGGITTFDLNNNINPSFAVDFTDMDNYWNDTTHHDDAAYDAHWGAEMTYDFFYQGFGWDSYNNQGAELISYVHYGNNFSNAFWDGLSIVYGDGLLSVGPWTSLDIVSHEFTHGLTQYSASLIYQDEPGALNESFSDIFGVAVDFSVDSLLANYQIGEEIGFEIRSLSDPNSRSHPDTYQGAFWHIGPGDNGGVHINSSVMNHWYYLLSEGGNGTNDLGNSYSVTGIGRDKATAIAFRNLTQYLTPTSQYLDARFYSIQAATDLYGPCSPEVASTIMAWYAVGVGYATNTVSSAFSASQTVSCHLPSIISFNNLSQNANSYLWDFGDGTTSTDFSPIHSYTTTDTFTVSLIATGVPTCGVGIDTTVLHDYILISNDSGANPPSCIPVPAIPTTNQGILSVSLGAINHPSGITNNGYDDYSCQHTTSLVEGSYYPISVSTSNFSGNNHLKIWIDFNNDSNLSPNEEVFTTSHISGIHNGTIYIPDSTILNVPLRLRIIFDGYSSSQIPNSCFNPPRGEIEDYSVIIHANTSPPVVDFTTNSQSVSLGQTISFTDQTSGFPSNWYWEFQGGTPASSTLSNPSVTYNSIGIYDVALKAGNGLGEDSLIQSQYISVTNKYIMCTTTLGSTPSGTLYDSGGPNAPYLDSESCTFLIDPSCGTDITLSFSSFDILDDHLWVFDGGSAAGSLLFTGGGNSLPPVLTATSGQMFIIFQSNSSATHFGWEANWVATLPPSVPPIADFSISDTTPPLNAPVQFTDLSQHLPSIWMWDFGDGSGSNAQHPIHAYSAAGSYPVTLIVDNCAGLDTIMHTLVVQQGASLIYAPDSLIFQSSLCNDSLSLPLSIYNSGPGDLYIEIESIHYPEFVYDSMSSANFTGVGNSTFHTFSNLSSIPDSFRLSILMNGDFNSFNEYAELYIEGTFIAHILDSNVSNGTDILDTFLIQGPAIPIWFQDQILELEIRNSDEVETLSGGINIHQATLSYANNITMISALPDSGVIPPGDSLPVQVIFDGEGIHAGTYTMDLEIINSDPANTPLLIPTRIEISGPPEITVPSTSFLFDTLQQFLVDSQSVPISNPGCDTLVISSIVSSNPLFSSSSAPLSILPDDTASIVLYYQAITVGTDSSTITVVSNASDATFSVRGTTIGSALASLGTDTLSAVMMGCDDSIQLQVAVANTGTGILDWTIGGFGHIPYPREVLAYTMGINTYKYANLISSIDHFFTDYQLSTSNTILPSVLENELSGKDVFLVPHIGTYGNAHFASFAPVLQDFVSQGGRVIFCGSYAYNEPLFLSGLITGSYYPYFTNQAFYFPNPNHPLLDSVENLSPLSQTHLISITDPDVEIVASNMAQSGQEPVAILRKPLGQGHVIYIGHNFSTPDLALSRLVANAVGSVDILHEFPDWLSVSVDSGSLAINDSLLISLTMSSQDLKAGIHHGGISFFSSDPVNPEIQVGISLTLIGEPHIDILYPLDSCLNFPPIQQFDSLSLEIPIFNSGCADMHITSVMSLDSAFEVQNQTITIAPCDTFFLPVSYLPTTIGSSSGEIMLMSDTGDTTICLSGMSNAAPLISVSPHILNISLAKCDSLTVPLTVHNTGAGPLYSELSAPLSNASLENLLLSLDNNFQTINSLILNRHDFLDGETGTSILDGGDDMYNSGNVISGTGSLPGIPYSNGIIQTSSIFGQNHGRYFTQKYPGLFVLAADLDGMSEFHITGNTGANGSGTVDGTILSLDVNDHVYKGFVKRVFDSNDPSVNHLIIVEDESGLNHSYSPFPNKDDHVITGLSNSSRLYYLLFSSINGEYMDDSMMLHIMESFIQENSGIFANWVSYQSLNQIVAAGDSTTYYATFSGTHLENGQYQDQLQILSNDPFSPVISVPVQLIVNGTSGPIDPICQPSIANTDSSTRIVSVEFHTIVNSSEKLLPLEDFSCTDRTEVVMDQSYVLSVSTSSGANPALSGWIDYNNDGIGESSETIISSVSDTNIHVASVSIPTDAVYDQPLRMRIGVEYGVSIPPSSCATIQAGQFEDYTVVIKNPYLPPVSNPTFFSLNNCQRIYQFVDQSQNNPKAWTWNFGDGFSSNEQNPTHVYDSSGIFIASLITGNDFGQDTTYFEVDVKLLEADFAYSGQLYAEDSILFMPLTPLGDSFEWNFGNGLMSSEETPEIVFDMAGRYEVTLTVQDDMGCEATYTRSILIGYSLHIGDLSFGTISVYPNPSSQTFWLDYTGVPHELSYHLYNHLGQVVLSGKINDNLGHVHQQIRFEESHARGVYTMKVEVNGEVWSTKVLYLE